MTPFGRVYAVILILGFFLVGSSVVKPQRTYHSFSKATKEPKKVFQLKLDQVRLKDKEWEEIGKFQNIQKLELRDNLLDTLPPAMGALSRMTTFKTKKNNIVHFPDSLKHWRSLHYLELTQTKLDTFPRICKYWKGLFELGIDRNRAEAMHLPAEIGELDQLKLLAINKSPLTGLPEEIGEMRSMRKLILPKDGLEKIPPTIGELSELRVLVLDHNELKSIPRDISRLKELEYLSLKGNVLEELPQRISALTNLKTLDIRKNNFSSYQIDILKALLPQAEIKHDPIGTE